MQGICCSSDFRVSRRGERFAVSSESSVILDGALCRFTYKGTIRVVL